MPESQKIKIVNVIVDLSMGGIERLTLNLCANLDPDIFDPTVVCINGGGPLEEEARALGVPVEVVGVPVRNLPKAVSALKQTFSKLRPDVIHGNPGLIARLAAPKGVPVISTYHNKLVGRNKPSRIIDRLLIKRSSYLVTISEHILRTTVESVGIAPEKMTVIYNGVNVERVREMAQAKTPPPSMVHPSAVFLGRLHREKGGDILIKAWRKVQDNFPDASLLMIGDGDDRDECEKLAASLDLNVGFSGQIENPYPLLAAAGIFVLPSREGGFELTLVEAMALGLPCVASDAGGIPEVADNAAILFKSENVDQCAGAITELLEDASLRAKYSELALERSRMFTIQRMAESYGELYLKALGK